MPWSEEHKQKTRERILDAAATLFRERGLEQTTVAEVMQLAGLTHGGFYAHFGSKDELVAEAFAHASEQLRRLFTAAPTGDVSVNSLLSAAEKYLSIGHMTHPQRGCPVAAFGTELIRGSTRVRQRLSQEIQVRLTKLCEGTDARLPEAIRRSQAAGALACMVGGQVLARGLEESEGREFLDACRRFLKTALEATGAGPENSGFNTNRRKSVRRPRRNGAR